MRVTVSEARPQLGHLCARAQDPRQIIVLTRHGRDIAALVSIEEVQRSWQLQNEAWSPKKCSVTGKRKGGALVLPEGMTVGPDGHIVTHRELAGIVRNIQIRRKEERELLAQGGLDPVEGGEIAMEMPEVEEPERVSFWGKVRMFFATALPSHDKKENKNCNFCQIQYKIEKPSSHTTIQIKGRKVERQK